MLVGEGLYDEQEEQRMEKDILAYKNTLLVPLYQSVRSIVAKLKASELDEVYQDLTLTVDALERSFGAGTPQFLQKKAEAERTFLALIKKMKADLDQPKVRLHRLRKQLVLVVNLLLKWREYTKILHMSFASARDMLEESQMSAPNTVSAPNDVMSSDEALRKAAQEFLNPADESVIQQRMEELANVDFEKPLVQEVGEFLDQYRDVLAPFMSPDQVKQIETDFSRLREAGASTYGHLRSQQPVTSDEFFKNILHGNKELQIQNQPELEAARSAAGDTLFGLLNLVYPSVS